MLMKTNEYPLGWFNKIRHYVTCAPRDNIMLIFNRADAKETSSCTVHIPVVKVSLQLHLFSNPLCPTINFFALGWVARLTLPENVNWR